MVGLMEQGQRTGLMDAWTPGLEQTTGLLDAWIPDLWD